MLGLEQERIGTVWRSAVEKPSPSVAEHPVVKVVHDARVPVELPRILQEELGRVFYGFVETFE